MRVGKQEDRIPLHNTGIISGKKVNHTTTDTNLLNTVINNRRNLLSNGFNLKNKMNKVFGQNIPASLSFDIAKNKNNIPTGHSKYEYNGAKLDIVEKNGDIKSQFVIPKGYNRQDFLNQFSNLNQITQSHERFVKGTNNSSSGINGMMDQRVLQGETGDCWLISGIESLNSTEKGKAIIKNAITPNNDGSATVNFQGVGVSYTISQSDINKYDTDYNLNDAYSNGDNDMLVMELATEKLWQDINSGKVQLNSTNEDITYSGYGNGISDGGLPNQMTYYLTGIEADEYYNDDLSNLDSNTIYSVLQNAVDKENTVLDTVIYFDTHSATLTDGTTYSLDVGNGGHSLSITNVTQDTVTIVNPWDTSASYTMSWDEFANLGIGYLSSADLNNVQTTDESSINETSTDESSTDEFSTDESSTDEFSTDEFSTDNTQLNDNTEINNTTDTISTDNTTLFNNEFINEIESEINLAVENGYGINNILEQGTLNSIISDMNLNLVFDTAFPKTLDINVNIDLSQFSFDSCNIMIDIVINILNGEQ